MKFVKPPKNLLDFAAQKAMAKKINALLNCKIIDKDGAPAGEVFFADGNTVFKITGGASATSITLYKITNVDDIADDFILAKEQVWDGSGTPIESGSETEVALPPGLWAASAPSLTHQVWPAYSVDDYIMVATVEVSGVRNTAVVPEPIMLQDIGEGRGWAIQVNDCDPDGNPCYRLAVASEIYY